jgi:uncharacterized protein
LPRSLGRRRAEVKPGRIYHLQRGELLQAIRRTLADETELSLAFVFGSLARGALRDESDVDLALLGEGDPFAVAARVSLATGREVDVVDLAQVSIPLLDVIVRDGVLVRERERGAGALFRSRALATLETDRPWYERMQRAWLERVASRGILG